MYRFNRPTNLNIRYSLEMRYVLEALENTVRQRNRFNNSFDIDFFYSDFWAFENF